MNHLARLPNEILPFILTALDDVRIDSPYYRIIMLIRLYECALVSKAFHAVATPLLWREPIRDDFCLKNVVRTECLLRSLESSCRPAFLAQHIRQLHICDPDLMQPMIRFMPFMTLLKTFTMSGRHIGWRAEVNAPLDLRELGPTRTRLEKVSLRYVRLGDPALVTISQWCGPIQDLTLEHCKGFTDAALQTLLDSCRTSLTSLKIDKNRWNLLLCKSLKSFSLNQLTSLVLGNCQGVDNNFLRDSRFPLLTECRIWKCLLDLGYAPGILSVFLRRHPLLRILTLDGCKINNAALAVMTPSVLPNLTHLDLSNNGPLLSCEFLRYMIRHCLGLSYMAVVDCSVPVRSFPEVFSWSGTIHYFQREDIIKIRNNNISAIFTAEDDVVREGERFYVSESDSSLDSEPKELESQADTYR